MSGHANPSASWPMSDSSRTRIAERRRLEIIARFSLAQMTLGDTRTFDLPPDQPEQRIAYQHIGAHAYLRFGRGCYCLHQQGATMTVEWTGPGPRKSRGCADPEQRRREQLWWSTA